jgi:transposase
MKSKKSRTKHSAAFKAKVALAALRDQEPVAEIARRYKVHANVVYKWKRQLQENVSRVFETEGGGSESSERESELLKKIGELTVERDFLADGLDRLR